jgi:hypothetical protein
MPKKKVISMLEFLRTGVLGGIACGCTITEVLQRFGKPDYKAVSPYVKHCSWFRYGSLEIWFHEETQIVNRMTLQRFQQRHRSNGLYRNKSHTIYRNTSPKRRKHRFEKAIPNISRKTIDPWILREGLDVYTLMRFLKTANLEFRHSLNRWTKVDQLDLDSGIYLFCDSPQEDYPGLSYIEIRDDLLWNQLNEAIED